MIRTWTIGTHEVRRQRDGVLCVAFRGDVEAHDAARLVSVVAEELRSGWIYIDVRAVGYISAEARRELTGLRIAAVRDAPRLDLGFIGASMRTKVLMTTIVSAASAVHRVHLRLHFFASPDDVPTAGR